MTEYLGVCMVIIVASLCIAILSTIVPENILKQMEAHKKRISDQRWAAFGKFIIEFRNKYKKDIDELVEKMKMERAKDFMKTVDKKTEELKDKGVKIEDI